MSPINIALCFIAFFLSSIVFAIHSSSKNIALLCLALVTALTNFVLLFGAFTLPFIPQAVNSNDQQQPSSSSSSSSPTPQSNDTNAQELYQQTQDQDLQMNHPAFIGICEAQAFFLNTLGLAVFGSCLSLALELYVRTSSLVILNAHSTSAKWRIGSYFFISFMIPMILIGISMGFRETGAQYIQNAYCDYTLKPLAFLVIIVVSSILYTISGSYFTIVSLYHFIRKRMSKNKAVRSIPSNPQMNMTNTISTTTPALGSNGLETLNKLKKKSSGLIRKNSTQQNSKYTSHILLRMVIWCAGYHLLAFVYVIQATYGAITMLNRGEASDPSSRSSTVLYVMAALSILLFICFGTGRSAVEMKNKLLKMLKKQTKNVQKKVSAISLGYQENPVEVEQGVNIYFSPNFAHTSVYAISSNSPSTNTEKDSESVDLST